MSNADKRSPTTDALETLGMIHFKPEARDAIHLAVEPVEAGQNLLPGQRIGILQGRAFKAGEKVSIVDDSQPDSFSHGHIVPYHGIVDPFLPGAVQQGQRFWFVMAPRLVTSLRHVWEHPDFPKGE